MRDWWETAVGEEWETAVGEEWETAVGEEWETVVGERSRCFSLALDGRMPSSVLQYQSGPIAWAG